MAGSSSGGAPTPPPGPAGPVGATVTVTVAARRLGVAAATLRSWDRRYGLGPSGHVAGSHRRYTEDDLRRLARMRELTLRGVAPSAAALEALETPAAPSRRSRSSREGDPQPPPRGLLARRRAAGEAAAAVPPAAATRGLRRAALALDAVVCDEILAASLRRRGALGTWQEVVAPALVGLGERWRLTGAGVDAEHVLSDSVLTAFRAVAMAAARALHGRPVLLAGVPEEAHALPLYALAAALAERRIPSRVIGASVPWPVIGAAVSRTGPPAVFLWSQRPATADLAGVATLPTTRPPARVVLCGPGWVGGRSGPGRLDVAHAEDLPSALAYGVWASGG